MRNPVAFCIVIVLLANQSLLAQSPLDTLIWNGVAENRVNLVVLGDGYQVFERDKFDSDALMLSEYLLESSPYREYESFFNIVQIWTASNESGAARDPSEPIDNYYGSTYNFAGIDRLLVPTKTREASQILRDYFPSYDMVMMLVNDEKYGGSGGWLATTSTHPSAPEIAVHEVGHSFANLADEYWAGPQYARERPNMTRETSPDDIKWKNWLGTQEIGIYPFQEDMNWHRPHQNCKMRRLGPPFCSVCTENTVESIHALVNTIDNYMPSADTVDVTNEDSILFTVDLIRPNPNTLESSWTIDGLERSRNSDSLFLSIDTLSEGMHDLVFLVVDSTQLSRADATLYRLHQVAWTIDKRGTTRLQSHQLDWDYAVGPNPASGNLIVRSSEQFEIGITDLSGKVHFKSSLHAGSHNFDCTKWGRSFVIHLTHKNIHRQHIILQRD